MTRAADDFAVIGGLYKKLVAVPEHKRTGSPTDHCAHCPEEPGDRCDKNCGDEGVKAGVVGLVLPMGTVGGVPFYADVIADPKLSRSWCGECGVYEGHWVKCSRCPS